MIRGPRDEIRLYDWSGEYDNGNTVSLRFSDGSADFSVKNGSFHLQISGLCSITDDSLVILDEKDGIGYAFEYTLHGDSIELSYRGDSILLEKNVEK